MHLECRVCQVETGKKFWFKTFDTADLACHKHKLLNSAQITLESPSSTFNFAKDGDEEGKRFKHVLLALPNSIKATILFLQPHLES